MIICASTDECTAGRVAMKDLIAPRYWIAWVLYLRALATFLKMIPMNDFIWSIASSSHSFTQDINILKWNNELIWHCYYFHEFSTELEGIFMLLPYEVFKMDSRIVMQKHKDKEKSDFEWHASFHFKLKTLIFKFKSIYVYKDALNTMWKLIYYIL